MQSKKLEEKISFEYALELARDASNIEEKINLGGYEGWDYAGSWFSKDEIEERGPNQYIRWIKKSFEGENHSLNLRISVHKEQKVIYGSKAGNSAKYFLNVRNANIKNNLVEFEDEETFEGCFEKYANLYYYGPPLKKLFSDLEKKNSKTKLNPNTIEKEEKKEEQKIKTIYDILVNNIDNKLNIPSGYYLVSSFISNKYDLLARTGGVISKSYSSHWTDTLAGKDITIVMKNKKKEIREVYATLISGGNSFFHSFLGNANVQIEPEKFWNLRNGSFTINSKEYNEIIKIIKKNNKINYALDSIYGGQEYKKINDITKFLKES